MARRLPSFNLTPSRLSMLAAIAFVFSLASFALSAGLIAIVLGMTVLRHARRSGQTFRGRRMAQAAVVIPILMPLLLFLFDAVSYAKALPPELSCGTNLSGIGKAMLVYANEYNDRLPTPSQWCDLLISHEGVPPRAFQCRGPQRQLSRTLYPLEWRLCVRHRTASLREGPCSYAMNEHGASVSAEPDVVLCYEAKPGWNQVGGPELLTTDYHEGRGCNIMFCDTHVEFVPTKRLGQLKWKPTK